MRCWLMKTEPGTFSLDDLRESPGGTAPWDGVRNYQARNHMRDGMRVGDAVLIYHSSTADRAIVGLARVAREAYPDPTAWNPKSDHFDPRSTPENPVWLMVDVQFQEAFRRPLLLEALRNIPELGGMMLLRRGMRLSIQPVTEAEFQTVLAYARGERPLPAAAAAAKPARAQAKPKAKRPSAKRPAAKSARRPAARPAPPRAKTRR